MPQPGEPPDRGAPRPYSREERSDPYGPERRSDGRNRGEAYHTDPFGRLASPREDHGRLPGGAAQDRRQYEEDQRAHRAAPPGPRLATPIGQPPRRQQSHPAHMTRGHGRRRLGLLVVLVLVIGLTAFGVHRFVQGADPAEEDLPAPGPLPTSTTVAPQAAAPPTAASGFA